MPVSFDERFWAKTMPGPNGCILWTASRGGADYGKVWDSRVGRRVYAHRLAYELTVGPIPDGLQIDHLCRVRLCVNPAHLEAVTREENIRRTRRTECQNGHPFDETNTYTDPSGRRHCRICDRVRHTEDARRRRRAS